MERAVPYMALAKRVSPMGRHDHLLVGDRDRDDGREGLVDLALGALDVDGRVLDVDLDLVGDGNGLFADAAHGGWSPYQTLQMSSPPALLRRQSASFIRPLEVEMMLIPRPLRTRGMSE
jgi:hypothetical protein